MPPWAANLAALAAAAIVAAWDLGFGAGGVCSVIQLSPEPG